MAGRTSTGPAYPSDRPGEAGPPAQGHGWKTEEPEGVCQVWLASEVIPHSHCSTLGHSVPGPPLPTFSLRRNTEAPRERSGDPGVRGLVTEPARIISTDCPPFPGQVPTCDLSLHSRIPRFYPPEPELAAQGCRLLPQSPAQQLLPRSSEG